jgi:hypothetical protein
MWSGCSCSTQWPAPSRSARVNVVVGGTSGMSFNVMVMSSRSAKSSVNVIGVRFRRPGFSERVSGRDSRRPGRRCSEPDRDAQERRRMNRRPPSAPRATATSANAASSGSSTLNAETVEVALTRISSHSRQPSTAGRLRLPPVPRRWKFRRPPAGRGAAALDTSVLNIRQAACWMATGSRRAMPRAGSAPPPCK